MVLLWSCQKWSSSMSWHQWSCWLGSRICGSVGSRLCRHFSGIGSSVLWNSGFADLHPSENKVRCFSSHSCSPSTRPTPCKIKEMLTSLPNFPHLRCHHHATITHHIPNAPSRPSSPQHPAVLRGRIQGVYVHGTEFWGHVR